jgi:hypothetical protein
MDSPDELICLSYCSTAAFEAAPQSFGVDPEVIRILIESRRFNRQHQIGGVLQFGNGYFFQYLEGPTDVVDRLYARICRDGRHRDVRRLTRRPVGSRRFEYWSMKFVAIDRVVGEVLRRHDLPRFDPYEFTPAIIDDMVVSCIHPPDEAPEADPDPQAHARSRKSLWRRLVGG